MSLIKLNPKSVFSGLARSLARVRLPNVVRDERGLSTVEYVILLALIAAVAIGTWTTFGGQVHDAISNSSDAFGNVVDASEDAVDSAAQAP